MSRVLDGRAAVVTGGSRGLGLAIAEAFVNAGASVVVAGRDHEALEAAETRLVAAARPDQGVLARACDVADAGQVEALADVATGAFPQLDIVVSNAAIHGPKGRLDEVDWAEWAHAVTVNLLGSALVVRAFLPQLRRRGYGKVLQLSGGGATAPRPGLSAYAAAKAGVVRLVETLAEELRADGIDVNAIAPGALNTRLLDDLLAAGPAAIGEAAYAEALAQAKRGGTPLERGSSLAVYLASRASDGITGRLISAVWDPWETLGDHRQALDGSDVYTLRRIVPADRGLDLGQD